MKRISTVLLKNIATLIIASAIGVCLIIYPQDTAQGIKHGLLLLGNNLIPSLFPFMVLSSYISQSSVAHTISRLFSKPFSFVFRINGYGIVPFILGLCGGYPVGAKTVTEFYHNGKLSQDEAGRLLYWCINPSPAFAITAVGTFMLRSTQSGVILYVSCILSALTIGFFCRFLTSENIYFTEKAPIKNNDNVFIKSVAKGSEGMLSICGWVLTFCVLMSLCDALKMPYYLSNIIKSVGEVTTGCENAINANLTLPVLAGILGFGGLAVICQCAVYSSACHAEMKYLLCSRVINAALSGIYCSILLKFFPLSEGVSVVIGTATTNVRLYQSVGTSIILLIMCVLLILEVDNRKKMC